MIFSDCRTIVLRLRIKFIIKCDKSVKCDKFAIMKCDKFVIMRYNKFAIIKCNKFVIMRCDKFAIIKCDKFAIMNLLNLLLQLTIMLKIRRFFN